MRRPGFFEGVLVAAALAFAAGVLGTVLTPLLGLPAAVRLLIPALGLAYLLYLLRRCQVRTGRVTALTAWAAVAVCAWWLAPPIGFYLAIHAGAIWLVRVLYYHGGLVTAFLDFCVGVAALALTAWAATHSGSVFLAAWCFFLVQASFALVPPPVRRRPDSITPANETSANEKFDRARRQAEAALHQLFSR
ncbi:MAG TPA: hypothetical protein VFY03_12645 [Woeseiaceae bacterium]|nr:hypothetical protein [Woeseiaceae bacterium]